MTGRVLSEEDILIIESQANYFVDAEELDAMQYVRYRHELDLIATIRFHEGIKKVLWEQNTIMREVLERVRNGDYNIHDIEAALAKVRGDE